MSVPNQTPYIIYNANGLTTVFPFEFYIISASDIQVSLNGTPVTTGFTVSGVGNVSGGDLTFLTPPANGTVVMLERVVPTYRLTDYQDNGDLLADTVNKDFDRLWMAIQRSFIYLGLALRRPLLGGPFNAEGYRIEKLADPVDTQDAATKNYVDQVGVRNLNRTLRVPENYVAPLAPAEQRANRLQAYNAEGNPIFVRPESGSAADVLVDLASTDSGKGDALIGVKQPYSGSVGRTQHDKNTDFINIRDYGIVGDGTDESAKWEKLISNFKGKKSVFAPSGIYTINSVIEAEGLTIYADRISFNGSGYLKQAVIVGTSSDGVPFIDMGSTLERQDIRWGKLFKIGSSDSGLSGLQIGGAGGAKFGSEGMVHHMDGYDGWAVETTSRWPSSTEHALMPSSRAGRCRFTAGNSSINIEIGADLLPQDIGQVVWIKDSAYVVTGVGDRNFTVTNPPNYSGVETYTCTYNWGKGKCTVTGKKITCTYGDPFNFVIPTRIVVNGIVNYIDSFIDTRNVVLRNDMGNLTDVDYFWSGTVDDLAAAFRLHRISGAGYEENISLIAYNKGYYHLHAGSGGPSQFPIFIGSGWDANGAARKSITVSGDGLVSIGGKYGTGALEVGYRQETDGDSNRLRIDSAKGGSGGGPTISALGTDANISINIRPKGTGVVKIDGVQEVNGANLPSIDNRYTSGSPSNRWNMVFSANGVQQTSDASLKTKIKPFTKEEVSAAIELSTGAGTYQWLKDCRDFGEQSGVHIGYTVQHVIEVLTKNGLNWENYKMIQKDDDSNVYSINYSEVIIFVMAGIVARLTK